jgi:heat-inducible transcriptional repressor
VSLYAPKTPPFDGAQSFAGLAGLDARARDIFRRIVESYLETGEPVGSRTLSLGGIALSPASIRNTMQDLTLAGLRPIHRRGGSRPMRACACSSTACWRSAT